MGPAPRRASVIVIIASYEEDAALLPEQETEVGRRWWIETTKSSKFKCGRKCKMGCDSWPSPALDRGRSVYLQVLKVGTAVTSLEGEKARREPVTDSLC
ncbi:hypothetical protein MRX96_038037 [Rhipicephalus microplus]